MKLLCLNTGGGFIKKDLHDFIAKHALDTDIFCFQEVFSNANVATLGDIDQNLLLTITKILSSHIGYYAPSQDNDEGLAIFVKPHIKLNEVGDTFVYRHRNAMEGEDRKTLGRNIQYLAFTQDDQKYTVVNFHGLWNGAGKTDSYDRIVQAQKVNQFLKHKAKGKIILAGDFNLEPNTESIAIIEEGMRNLIKEYNVASTRSDFYKWDNKFADYVLVSKDLEVMRFEVLQDQISDHLPLVLEF